MNHYRGNWLDHSFLSPNGRVSKRARAAAEKVMHARMAAEIKPPTEAERMAAERATRAQEARSKRSLAATIRHLAAAGSKPRKYTAEAMKLENEAAELERG